MTRTPRGPVREVRSRVYLIGGIGVRLVKIGVSNSPAYRLADLQTGSPVPLTLLWHVQGGQDLERRLHKHFAENRVYGEWFDFDNRDPVTVVSRAAAKFGASTEAYLEPLPQVQIGPETEELEARPRVLAYVDANPEASLRVISQGTGVSRSSVCRYLKAAGLR